MESIENVNEVKQTAPPPPPSPAADQDGDDRISDLCDDVLARTLALADVDARELVRTGVLSRRWRGLWTRVPGLHFTQWQKLESAGDVGRYVALVSSVLAQRAQSEAGIDLLVIPLFMVAHCLQGQRQQLVPPAMEAAEAWIRYAVQHQVRRFYFKLRLPIEPRPAYEDSNLKKQFEELLKSLEDSDLKADEEKEDGGEDEEDEGEEADDQEDAEDEEKEADEDQSSDDEEGNDDDEDEQDKPVIDLGELPSSTKLETMRIGLSCARVRLPCTAVFPSLKDLKLEFVDLAPGSGHLLARLLSPACCPSLRRLRMYCVTFKRSGTRELVLDAGQLLQLSVENMNGMKTLELRTSSLLYLEIEGCDELRSVAVSAPELEELTFQHNRRQVAIHGDFPCVRSLKVDLVTHLYSDDDINDSRICLLKRCSSSARSLFVYLDVPSDIERRVDLIKNKIGQLPNVTHLSVNLHPICDRHSLGDGVAGLLTRFNNLESLILQLDELPAGCIKRDDYYGKDADGGSAAAFACNHADHWESLSSDISLGSLREVRFRGMTGTGCELRFLQFVLAAAGATDLLESVSVSFSASYSLGGSRIDYFVRTLLGLGDDDDGAWTASACEDDNDDVDCEQSSYRWTRTPCAVREDVGA